MTRKATPCIHNLPVTKCKECLAAYRRTQYDALVNDPVRYAEKIAKNEARAKVKAAKEKKARYLADNPGIISAAYDKMLAAGRIE